MEEDNYFTQTQLPALLLLPLQPLTFSLHSLHVSQHSHSHNVLLSCSLFIGKNGGFSSSTTTAAHGLMHLSMVGATTIDKW